jgi:hypothetical protein
MSIGPKSGLTHPNPQGLAANENPMDLAKLLSR